MKIKSDHWSWSVEIGEANKIIGIDPGLAKRVMSSYDQPYATIAARVEDGAISMADFLKLNKTVSAGAACMYCGKHLTDVDSIKRGAGPVCLAREGHEHDADE